MRIKIKFSVNRLHLLIFHFMGYGAFFQALASFPTRKKTAINAKGSNQVYSASCLVKLA